MGAILIGVGLSFPTVHIVTLAFTTLGHDVAELDVLRAFAWALTVVEVLVGGDVRGSLPCVLSGLCFAKLERVAATSNHGFIQVATFGTVFAP